MALRSKGEIKPVCHDMVLVDVGECYSSTSSTTVTVNRIDKFLWVSCKEAKRVQKIESEKGCRNADDEMRLPFGLRFVREIYSSKLSINAPSLGNVSVFA